MKQSNKFIRLSFHGLGLYNSCPLQYKRSYVEHEKGVQPPLNKVVVEGSILHELAETWYKSGFHLIVGKNDEATTWMWDNVRWITKKFLKDNSVQDSAQDLDEMVKGLRPMVKNMMKGIVQHHLWGDQFIAEIPLDYRVSPITIMAGRSDLVHFTPNYAEVFDFKGVLERNIPNCKEQQLHFYALMASKRFNIPVTKASFFFVRTGEMRSVMVGEPELQAASKACLDCANSIRAEKFPATPGDACRWCSHQETCPALRDSKEAREKVKSLKEGDVDYAL